MKTKLIILSALLLMILSCNANTNWLTSFLFYSQDEQAQYNKEAQQTKLPDCYIYAIIQQDTISITQVSVKNKPHRDYKDIKYIGYGLIDHYEFNQYYKNALAIFIHFKSFKRTN